MSMNIGDPVKITFPLQGVTKFVGKTGVIKELTKVTDNTTLYLVTLDELQLSFWAKTNQLEVIQK